MIIYSSFSIIKGKYHLGDLIVPQQFERLVIKEDQIETEIVEGAGNFLEL